MTETLAVNFGRWQEPLGLRVGWLAGKQKGKAREQQMQAIADGEVQMVVGTHAMFQEQVRFHHLVLAIIDEQH